MQEAAAAAAAALRSMGAQEAEAAHGAGGGGGGDRGSEGVGIWNGDKRVDVRGVIPGGSDFDVDGVRSGRGAGGCGGPPIGGASESNGTSDSDMAARLQR
eukprot:1073300-Pleurochrysis_carterae.AAC.1